MVGHHSFPGVSLANHSHSSWVRQSWSQIFIHVAVCYYSWEQYVVNVSELLLSFIPPFLRVWVSFPGWGPAQSDPVSYRLSQRNQGMDRDWKYSHKQLACSSGSFISFSPALVCSIHHCDPTVTWTHCRVRQKSTMSSPYFLYLFFFFNKWRDIPPE